MKIPSNIFESARRSFSPVSPGWYKVELYDVCSDEASTGTSFLNVEFKILDPFEERGRSVWANFFLTQEAAWKLAALMKALGLELSEDLNTEDLTGKELRVRVKEVEDQEGNLKSEVVAFRRLTSKPSSPNKEQLLDS